MPLDGFALSQGNGDLRVMNYNVYEGTNFTEISQAHTFPEFLVAVGDTITNVRATNPLQRMQAVATQILNAAPTMVSLEEIARWGTGSFDPVTQTCGAISVEFDTLQELLDSLAAQGGHYAVAVKQTQWNFPPVPGLTSSGFLCVQFTGYNAILVRTDLPGSMFSWSNAQSGLYVARIFANTPVGSLPLPGAWESIDVQFHNRAFRFIGTDFDAVDAGVREQQGAELRSGAANTSLPVIVAMDSNSQAAPLPQDATYLDFLAAGYADTWANLNPRNIGLSCCQNEFVNNPVSEFYTRIDLILNLGAVRGQQIELFGNEDGDKTADGLWPSDHAGIAAQMLIQ
jgi:hypothetical protein